MSITVSDLVATRELKLRLLNEGTREYLHRHIVWVHQSELLHSREFSEPGEILLTVGLNLAHPPEPGTPAARSGDYQRICDDYVQGMYESGVLACGFGIGVEHDAVPQALVASAREYGLPLFEVPLEIRFQSIERRVSQSLADDEHDLLHATYTAQRRLISATRDDNPLHAILLRTAESIGGWAAFVSPDFQVADISHIASRTFAAQLALSFAARQQQDTRSHAAPTHTMFVIKDNIDCCVFEVLDSHGTTYGYVVSGIPVSERTDMSLRSITMTAAELLSSYLPHQDSSGIHLRNLRGTAMRSLALNQSDVVRHMSKDLWGKLPQEPLRVLCVKEPAADMDRHYAVLSSQSDYRIDVTASTAPYLSVLFGEYDDALWLCCSAKQAERCRRLLGDAASSAPTILGASENHVWEDIGRAFDEARTSLLMSTISGIPSSQGKAIGLLDQIDLTDRQVASSFAHSFLAPLLGGPHGTQHTTSTLMATLLTLVGCSFNISTCAEQLGTHRHTIENRMARIEQLLGVDLHNVRDISRIWFATQCLARDRDPATAGGTPR